MTPTTQPLCNCPMCQALGGLACLVGRVLSGPQRLSSVPLPHHFLGSGECCQKKGEESRRVRGDPCAGETSPWRGRRAVAANWAPHPGNASTDAQILPPGQGPSPVCVLHPLYTCSGLLSFFLQGSYWDTSPKQLMFINIGRKCGDKYVMLHQRKWDRIRRTKGKKAQDGVERGAEWPMPEESQLPIMFILVTLSHPLPSCKAVSLLMLTCGWEAGNFRSEERWLLNNDNHNQQESTK